VVVLLSLTLSLSLALSFSLSLPFSLLSLALSLARALPLCRRLRAALALSSTTAPLFFAISLSVAVFLCHCRTVSENAAPSPNLCNFTPRSRLHKGSLPPEGSLRLFSRYRQNEVLPQPRRGRSTSRGRWRICTLDTYSDNTNHPSENPLAPWGS